MSEMEMKCSEARDMWSSSLARERTDTPVGVDKHLKECSSCNVWSRQMNEIVTVASGMPQFDVPESLTQSVLKAVEAEGAHRANVFSGANILQALFGIAVVAIMMFEAAEDFGGLISWAVGLGIVYSITLLVSSNREVETT